MLVDSSFAGFIPKAFKGDFIQIKQTRRSTKKTPVKIQYQFPKNIRMDVQDADNAVVYVCNAKKTWIYSPPFMKGEKGHVREGASSKYCYSKIFDALSSGLTSNKHYQVKKITETQYQLNFTSTAAEEIGFDEIKINFFKAPLTFENIDSLVMQNKDNKSPVTLKKQKLKLFKNLSSKTFIFEIPKNTEIEQMN